MKIAFVQAVMYRKAQEIYYPARCKESDHEKS